MENPETPRRKRGRPRKVRLDPATVDPLAVLAQIAADPKAAPSARIRACKLLLEHEPAAPEMMDWPKMDAEVVKAGREMGLDRVLKPPTKAS